MYKRERNEHNKVVHSPSLCWWKDNKYLTYYECQHEGWTQKVVLLKKVKGGWKRVLELPYGTGNPVLVPTEHKLYLAYSKFKGGTEKITNVLFLWKNCDMFIAELIDTTDSRTPGDMLYEDVGFYQNMCPRCAPLEIPERNTILLPVYDEYIGAGYIISFTTKMLESGPKCLMARHSIIYNSKTKLIQPTIWLSDDNLWFEARNFNSIYDSFGITGCFHLGNMGWSVDRRDDICNFRESVHRFRWNDKLWRIFGNAQARTELLLTDGIYADTDNGNTVKLNTLQKGCYPNHVINPDGSLTVCFTHYNSRLGQETEITLKTFDKDLNLLKEESI